MDKTRYTVQFARNGYVEQQLAVAPPWVQDEFTKDMNLLLQSDPFRDQGNCQVVESPAKDGYHYVIGRCCFVQYVVDPIEKLVKVTTLDWF